MILYSEQQRVPKVAPKRPIKAQTSGISKSQQKQTGGVPSSGKMITKENSQVTQASRFLYISLLTNYIIPLFLHIFIDMQILNIHEMPFYSNGNKTCRLIISIHL